MGRELNLKTLQRSLQEHGLSQSSLSARIGVSRTAVTNWLKGRDFPRPDKLLRLGVLLGLPYKELVVDKPGPLEPVVAFRRKGGRKTKPEHIERAKHVGAALRPLVPLLPFDHLVQPPVLKDPVREYGYLQEVSRDIRARVGVEADQPLEFQHLVGLFGSLQAVLVPVLLGHKEHHENALHIHLPESRTTWVFLNLDSKLHDFNFWMAHELGHAYSPNLREDEGEDFADDFAQALLFPEECVRKSYPELKQLRSPGVRIVRMKEVAQEFGISPIIVNLAFKAYAKAHDITSVDAGEAIYAAATNFGKSVASVSKTLFEGKTPSPADYIRVSREVFQSPFFDVLAKHVRANGVSIGLVQTILQVTLLDAKALLEELR